jgi:hypothetical protein
LTSIGASMPSPCRGEVEQEVRAWR